MANEKMTPAQFRKASGRRGRDASGKETEAAVLAAAADSLGRLLTLNQIPNGVGFGGGGRVFATQTPYDFAGAVIGSGRGFFTDGKHVAADEPGKRRECYGFNFAKAVKRHQWEALERLGWAGAVAGLTVQAEPVRRWLWLDWRFLADCAVARGPISWDNSEWWYDLGPTTHQIKYRSLVTDYPAPDNPLVLRVPAL